MEYNKPTAEKVEFEAKDVITASGCPGNSNNKNSGQGQGCKSASSKQGSDNGTRNQIM
ncbi:MAG: hypothetical protein Q4B67_08445 [Eubacteriales bacterium]|nr:hypothetical protein [Eubacteriales bacterium]